MSIPTQQCFILFHLLIYRAINIHEILGLAIYGVGKSEKALQPKKTISPLLGINPPAALRIYRYE